MRLHSHALGLILVRALITLNFGLFSSTYACAQDSATVSIDDMLDKGDTHFDNGDYNDALSMYLIADQAYPNQAKVKVSLAAAYAELGRNAEGLCSLDEAVALDPSRLANAEIIENLRERLGGKSAPSDVAISAEEALAIKTASKILLRAQGKSPEEAKELAREARRTLAPALWDPRQSSIEAWRVAGVTAILLEDMNLGAFTYEAIARLNPDYHLDPGLLDLLAELKARNADQVALSIGSSKSECITEYMHLLYGAVMREPVSLNNIGVLYVRGECIPMDHIKAIEHFRVAAELGDTTAMQNLGQMYYNGVDKPSGLNVATDYVQSAEWYKRGAEAGEVNSKVMYGYLLELGRGVQQDPVESIEWYKSAARDGSEWAKNNLLSRNISWE